MSDQDATSAPSLKLFHGEPQHDVFPRLKEFFPTGAMTAAATPFVFPEGEPIELPEHYEFEGETRSTEAFFELTDTASLLVLKDGAVRFERYALTAGRDVQWISWSVAKSFVSALVGIALEEGHIGSIEEPISKYVPVPAGTAYDGVSIRDVLQMSSGASWNEDYTDRDSDINRFSAAMSGTGTLAEFVAGMQRACEPGTVCQYNSADTQVLTLMLIAATGRTLTDYMQEKLCDPLGMEAASYWLLDGTDVEMGFGGLNMVARDFARIGELFRNGGTWQGQQLIPAAWARASVVPDAPHLQPGQVLVGGHVLPLGYACQWWVPAGDRGEFSAIGIYNQFVYVDPSRGLVIVKQSSNRAYGTTGEEEENKEMETIEFLRAIGRVFD